MSSSGNKKPKVMQGAKRLTRLQAAKLNIDIQDASFATTPVYGEKVSSWVPTSCPAYHKSDVERFPEQHAFSLPDKRLKEAANGRQACPGAPDVESDGDSSSDQLSQYQAVIKKILGSLPPASLGTMSSPVRRSHIEVPLTSTQARSGSEIGGHGNALLTDIDNVTIPPPTSFFGTNEQVLGGEHIVSSNVVEERLQENANLNSMTAETISLGLTEIVGMCADEDFSIDEVESCALVEIPGTSYRVKRELAPIIKAIVKFHGDIAANYVIKGLQTRIMALGKIAEIIKNFQTKKCFEFSQHEIHNELDIVCDFSDTKLNVGWLQQRLEDILEAKKLIKDSSTLKEKRDKIYQEILEKKRKLEEQEQKVVLAKKGLDAVQAESENIKLILSDVRAKVKYFVDHPPFDGLI